MMVLNQTPAGRKSGWMAGCVSVVLALVLCTMAVGCSGGSRETPDERDAREAIEAREKAQADRSAKLERQREWKEEQAAAKKAEADAKVAAVRAAAKAKVDQARWEAMSSIARCTLGEPSKIQPLLAASAPQAKLAELLERYNAVVLLLGQDEPNPLKRNQQKEDFARLETEIDIFVRENLRNWMVCFEKFEGKSVYFSWGEPNFGLTSPPEAPATSPHALPLVTVQLQVLKYLSKPATAVLVDAKRGDWFWLSAIGKGHFVIRIRNGRLYVCRTLYYGMEPERVVVVSARNPKPREPDVVVKPKEDTDPIEIAGTTKPDSKTPKVPEFERMDKAITGATWKTVGWKAWAVPADHAVKGFLHVGLQRKLYKDWAFMGVGFGPAAEKREDKSFRWYERQAEAAIKALAGGKSVSRKEFKIEGKVYTQLFVVVKPGYPKEPISYGVLIGVEDKRVVSYWYWGVLKWARSRYIKSIGTAKPVVAIPGGLAPKPGV